MKAILCVTAMVMGTIFAAALISADEAAPSNDNEPSASEEAEATAPPAPKGPPHDGAIDARAVEMKEFTDALDAIANKAKSLQAEVKGAATADQKARATQIGQELDQFLAARKRFIDQFQNWPEFEPYDKGIPYDATVRFGFPGFRFAVGDFDEDRRLDIAAIPREDPVPVPAPAPGAPAPAPPVGMGFYVWLNKGDGAWVESRKGLADKQPPHQGGQALTADFNGDGHLDLIFYCSGEGFFSYKGDGKGNWEKYDSGLPATAGASHIECGDVGGDGSPDIVVSNFSPNPQQPGERLAFFSNDGKGKFTRAACRIPETNLSTEQFALADINKDGKIDIVGNAILINDGKYNWHVVKPPIDPTIKGAENIKVDYTAVADLNGDGYPDIVYVVAVGGMMWRQVPAGFSGLKIYLNDGKGGWAEAKVENPTDNAYRTVEIADFNGDGNMDIVAMSTMSSNGTLILGDGKGGFQQCATSGLPQVPMAMQAQGTIYSKVRDVDGDGLSDLIVLYFSSPPGGVILEDYKTLRVWRNVSLYARTTLTAKAIRQALAAVK